ncbi:MAG: TIGR04255 family protein [Nitrospira sp.]|nr:TIGR04255 family protein [Nitrospira sp.]
MPVNRKELKNKPLVEVILELKWVLQQGKQGPQFSFDTGYRLLLGRFFEKVKAEYPAHKALPTASVPDEMVAGMVQHRFQTQPDSWPLIQLGPGVLTVNETSGYTWEDFSKRCQKAITYLLEAYPTDGGPKVDELTLWYIDAVECNYSKDNLFKFLEDKMKVKIQLPDSLFTGIPVGNAPTSFHWEVAYPINSPKGQIKMRFRTGVKQDVPAIIWETLVVSKGTDCPALRDFSGWLTSAHEVTDEWFFRLIEGDLEKRFS